MGRRAFALALFFILMPLGQVFVGTVGAQIEYQGWWDAGWTERITVWVNETNGVEQDECIIDLWLDLSHYNVANATNEVRVTYLDTTLGEEEEVPMQVVGDRNDGTRSYEARVVFQTRPLDAGDRHVYYIYFNNPGVNQPSPHFTDFKPDLIKNRIVEPTFENNNYEFEGPSDVEEADGLIYVCDRGHHRVLVYDGNGTHVRTFGTTREPGSTDTSFNHPSGIDIHDGLLYVADEGNQRVQVLTLEGGYVETLGTTDEGGSDMDHLDSPKDVAVASDGTVYVTDYENHRVQVYFGIDDGTADSTIGTGQGGNANDEFDYPLGIAVTDDRLYVADSGNHRVQVLDRQGTWLATRGVTDVVGDDNQHLDYPYGISTDAQGQLAVADLGNHRVQLYNFDGIVSASFGVSGQLGAGREYFREPYNVAIGDGRIYVADYGNDRVQIFNVGGEFERTLGGRSQYAVGDLEFEDVRSVEVDGDLNVYVGDRSNHRVQVFDELGEYLGTIGITGEPGAANTHLNKPADIDVTSNSVYVVDGKNQRLQVYDRNLTYVTTLGGSPGTGNYSFNDPFGFARTSNGTMIVADTYNDRVMVYHPNGTFRAQVGTGVSGNASDQFRHPYDVELDADEMIYILDTDNYRIQVFYPGNLSLAYTLMSGTGGPANDQLKWPCGFSLRGDRMAVADTYNHRVQILNLTGGHLFTIGVTGTPGSDDAHFSRPRKVDLAPNGDIYVADADNNRIQIFDSTGTFKKTLGFSRKYSFDDDHFYSPGRVAVDGDGQIYVADTSNHRVQVFSQFGVLESTLGSASVREAGDDNEHLFVPRGVTITGDNIYVADTGNERVQVFSASGHYKETIGVDCYAVDSSPDGKLLFSMAPYHCVRIESADHSMIRMLGVNGTSGNDTDHLNFPLGAAMDANGRVYVADSFNHRVLIYNDLDDSTADGQLGETGIVGSDSTHLNTPSDVAWWNGRLYVADSLNHRIQVFEDDGSFLYTIGVSGVPGADNVHFREPTGVSVNGHGQVFVADLGNHRVVRITDIEMSSSGAEPYVAPATGEEPFSLGAWLRSPAGIVSISALLIIVILAALVLHGRGAEKGKTIPGKLDFRPGRIYLIDEPKPRRTSEFFNELAPPGSGKGLVVARTPAGELKEVYGLEPERIYWLSRIESTAPGVEIIAPSPLPLLTDKLVTFLKERDSPVIMLEGTEHLISENGFHDVLRFLEGLLPTVVTQKGIVLLPVDRRTLSQQEFSLLERESYLID